MSKISYAGEGRGARIVCFAIVAAVHLLLLVFFVLDIDIVEMLAEAPSDVLKLTDVEELPPPPPDAPPPIQSTADPIAQTVIASDVPVVSVAAPAAAVAARVEAVDYLPAHKISKPPRFDSAELLNRIVYPPIAQRSNIEGRVTLELFIDKAGFVRNVIVLKEDPEGRGFADAAVRALQGFRASSPAEANGEPVAVRYRYPVTFALKN